MLAVRMLAVGLLALLLPMSTALSTAEVTRMQSLIVGLINSSATTNNNGALIYPLVPAFVRLSFHDCNGPAGCDGCVNLAIDSNKGLRRAVSALETLYTNTANSLQKISRADFWALAGLVAANYGAKFQRPPPPPAPPGSVYIPSSLVPTTAFRTGRTDCPTAPVGSETDASFPDGLKGQVETLAFFRDNYNFTDVESVAILGAHTLGKATLSNSGFQGPWVPGNNILSNQYYKDLSNAALGWAQAVAGGANQAPLPPPPNGLPPPPPPPTGKIQWQHPGPNGNAQLIMLNADMGLYKNLNLNATDGSCSCTYGSCPMASTYQTVVQYAADNRKWLDDFGAAFNKLTSVCGRPSPGVVTSCSLSPLTSVRRRRSRSTPVTEAASEIALPVP